MNPDTDRWVRSDEARTRLRDLIDEVLAEGAHIHVLRYDKPVAVLVPVGWHAEMMAQIRQAAADLAPTFAHTPAQMERQTSG